MTSITHNISFSLPARLEDVRLLAVSAQAVFTWLEFKPVNVYQLELALVEAANNIIIHAYQNQPGKRFNFSLDVSGSKITCVFRDQGIDADFLSFLHTETSSSQEVEDLVPSKRGLPIICTVMDEVFFKRSQGINILTLIKNLP